MFQRIADFYTPAVHLVGGIVVLLDQDGRLLSFNECLETTTGYTYMELIQKNGFDLLLAEKEKPQAKRYFRRFVLRGKSRSNIVTKMLTRSGIEIHIEWHCKLLSDEVSVETIGVLAVGQDISDRVRQENQLLDDRMQLIERNKELTCLYEMAKIVGQDKPLPQMLEEIAAIISPAFQHPSITQATIRLDRQSYGGGDAGPSSLVLTEKLISHGIHRGNIDVTYQPSKNSRQKIIIPFLNEERSLLKTIAYHLALAIEKKEALDHKAEIEGQLRHADRLAKIGELTAGVAHELNEPLGNILGFAQLAKKADNLPDSVANDLANIVKASLHAREIIKKLMLFSRQTPPQSVAVDLNRLIEDGISLFESRCAKNGIVTVKSLSPDLPVIKADPSQLQQILANLIVNALQAMPDGGNLNIGTAADKQHVCLKVEDSGTGMRDETVSQIFIPFYTTKDVDQGTGLGLSVVHGIVKAHEGMIEVKSRMGHGTCFLIKFPLNGPKPEEKNDASFQ